VVRELGESFPLNMIDNISIRYTLGSEPNPPVTYIFRSTASVHNLWASS
jgi:hypothetical protein